MRRTAVRWFQHVRPTSQREIWTDADLGKYIRENLRAARPKGRTTARTDSYCENVYQIIESHNDKGIRGPISLVAALGVCSRMHSARWSDLIFKKFSEWGITPTRRAYLEAMRPPAANGNIDVVSEMIRSYLALTGKTVLDDPDFYHLLLYSLCASGAATVHSINILQQMSTLGISSPKCYSVVLDSCNTVSDLSIVKKMLKTHTVKEPDNPMLLRSFIKAYSNLGMSRRILMLIVRSMKKDEAVPYSSWHRLMESYGNNKRNSIKEIESGILETWKRMVIASKPIPASYRILIRFYGKHATRPDDEFIKSAEEAFNHGCSLNLHLNDIALWEALVLCYVAVSDIEKVACLLHLCPEKLRYRMNRSTIEAVSLKYPALAAFFRKRGRKKSTPALASSA
eukprot:TRINITY_DN11833_c0_g2_i1.p1 TRINITY_DN11833_c0_g2~~TRINITY_DN11833_c0_g2_i1.p1  ORF type:complete len:398 (+),score=38.25 TRINITY_DN11833_c0_g2_i1:143-1336(+)